MSFQRYFSPAQFESDQKDLIISQLKADIYELKKNQQDYYEINSQLQSLQNRYEMLQREKGKNEMEYKSRNDNSFRQIQVQKEDIEGLNAVLKQKQMETRELKGDNIQLQELNQQRLQEQQRLNQEMYGLVESLRKLGKDKEMNLGHELVQKDQNKRAQMDIAETRKDIQDIEQRNTQLQQDINREESFKQNEEKVLQVSNSQIAEARVNLNGLKDQVFYQDQSGNNQKQRLKNYEEELGSLRRQKEQQGLDLVHMQQESQKQRLEGEELGQVLTSHQNKHQNKQSFGVDLKENISTIRSQNDQVIQANQQLTYDLDQLKKYINLCMLSNQQLVEEMEELNEVDEQVRVLLNRQARVKDVKARTINNTNRMTSRLDHTSSFKQISHQEMSTSHKKGSPFNTLSKQM